MDWVVETVEFELAARHPVIEPVSTERTRLRPQMEILHGYALPGNNRMDALSSGPLSVVAPPRRLGSHSARHDFLVALCPHASFVRRRDSAFKGG
jgi:hypothetical protein